MTGMRPAAKGKGWGRYIHHHEIIYDDNGSQRGHEITRSRGRILEHVVPADWHNDVHGICRMLEESWARIVVLLEAGFDDERGMWIQLHIQEVWVVCRQVTRGCERRCASASGPDVRALAAWRDNRQRDERARRALYRFGIHRRFMPRPTGSLLDSWAEESERPSQEDGARGEVGVASQGSQPLACGRRAVQGTVGC
nr:hypothetical protein CFP56_13216 [Quercus suber]